MNQFAAPSSVVSSWNPPASARMVRVLGAAIFKLVWPVGVVEHTAAGERAPMEAGQATLDQPTAKRDNR